MTREKKELLKQLQEIDWQEDCELSMDGSGELGSRICETFDDLRRPIYERLNVLMHGRLNDYYGACVVNEEGESRMDSVQEVCDLLTKCVKQVQED